MSKQYNRENREPRRNVEEEEEKGRKKGKRDGFRGSIQRTEYPKCLISKGIRYSREMKRRLWFPPDCVIKRKSQRQCLVSLFLGTVWRNKWLPFTQCFKYCR